MKHQSSNRKTWIAVPPWIILGAVCVLVPIFAFMTIQTINRQKEDTTQLLVEKGAALIRSFEAGARTGMMGMRWGGFQVQRLLMETAQQPDIVYLLITDVKGTILAHNDPSKIGKFYEKELALTQIPVGKEIQWREVPNQGGSQIFEVYRQFSPIRGKMRDGGMGRHLRQMMSSDWCRPHLDPDTRSDVIGQLIFVGLDMGPIETARKEDARHAMMMALIFLLVGFAGIVSLFLAHAYRSTRTSLSRVKAFSDNLVENMPVGLLAIDQEGNIASFNHAAEAVLGIPFRDAFGKNARDILPQRLLSLIDEVKTEGVIVTKEIECPVSNEKSIPLDMSATTLRDQDGAFMGYLILFRDLTEIKNLQEEVERSQRLASIGRLAAGVAHEIRNPLSSIKGFATYFKERFRDVPEDQKTAEIMIQEVDRLNKVISQLLEFARPLSIQRKATSLKPLVEQTLKMIDADAKKKGIEIDFHGPPDKVLLDSDRFKQVLLNLYLNALDAMQEGGKLSVELQHDESAKQTQILITDTGNGISEMDLPHVFDPYYTTKSSGTGLGLAIVHKIMKAHGGDVKIESELGNGTTITLSIAT